MLEAVMVGELGNLLTPFSADFAASLAFLLPLGLAAPVKTYASAIALEELAKSAAAVRLSFIR